VFASPSSALAPRDRWIGWTAQARLEGLGMLHDATGKAAHARISILSLSEI